GRVAALALPGATPLKGGLPLLYGGRVVGAIGVSGNTPQEDEDIARAGVAAFDGRSDAASSPIADISPTDRKPDASIDLATKAGVALVKGEWRYSDTKIIDVDFRAAGADGQPSGVRNKTYDFVPHGGAADFDDSKWEALDPA